MDSRVRANAKGGFDVTIGEDELLKVLDTFDTVDEAISFQIAEPAEPAAPVGSPEVAAEALVEVDPAKTPTVEA